MWTSPELTCGSVIALYVRGRELLIQQVAQPRDERRKVGRNRAPDYAITNAVVGVGDPIAQIAQLAPRYDRVPILDFCRDKARRFADDDDVVHDRITDDYVGCETSVVDSGDRVLDLLRCLDHV